VWISTIDESKRQLTQIIVLSLLEKGIALLTKETSNLLLILI
jgi:hypothetical protein